MLLVDRLIDDEPVGTPDLIEALDAAYGGPAYVVNWGKQIVEVCRRQIEVEESPPSVLNLFDFLNAAAAKQFAYLHPLDGALEAPPELLHVYGPHAQEFDQIRDAHQEVMAALVADAAAAFLRAIGTVTWGDLARFDSSRDQPSRPAGYDDIDDF